MCYVFIQEDETEMAESECFDNRTHLSTVCEQAGPGETVG